MTEPLRKEILYIGIILFGLSLGTMAHANTGESTTTWLPTIETAYRLTLNYSLCPNATGNTTIQSTVTGIQFGQPATDASVFATIRKPDTSTADVNFTNDGGGAYSYTYNFDVNGTYLIQARAYKTGVTPGDMNGYVYLGDLNWTSAFLNNGFSIDIGELGTIRNTVTNSDGNLVYDINANTTIYYPNGTVADANASMSQIANGEFARSFFGPTPAGAYTVASLFKCGNRYNWNNSGTFTTNAASTGGGSTTGGTTGSGGESSGSGGGGGGGGGASAGKRAQILSMEFEPVLAKDGRSTLYATVQNLTNAIADYKLAFTLTAPDESVYINQKTIQDAAPYSSTRVAVDPSITPAQTGTYTLTAVLSPQNGTATYDTYSTTFDVQGIHSIQMDVQPTSNNTAQGLTYPFTLNLLNNGNFTEENIQIDWFLTDPNGNQYTESTFSTTLAPGESKTLAYSPFIPIDIPVGTHELNVQLHAYGITQEKKTSFNVSSPNDYYALLLSDLELRADQIKDKINSLQQRGFDVSTVSLTLLDIQTELARAKGMLLAGNYETLNTKLLDLSARITRLAAMVDALEQQSPLLSREGLVLILYIGAALLLALFLWFLFWLHKREKEEKKHPLATAPGRKLWAPGFLPKWLFTTKSYYSPQERKNLKRKLLISRILGLVEKEEE